MARILVLIFGLVYSVATFAAETSRNLDKIYKKEKFSFGSQKFEAYVADTEEGRADGLMFITKIPDNTGMLFVFENEQPLSFWMKNTLIPLAIGFLDKDGVLVDMQEMVPAASVMQIQVPTYQSRKPAAYALEMNKGWFTRHKVKLGAKLKPLPARH